MTRVTNADNATTDEGIAQVLRNRVRLLDLLLLSVLPTVLVVVYTLPTATRRSLSFLYTDPTPFSAYTAHFVHFTPNHLIANLLAYVILVSVCYALAVLADQRLFFGTAAVVVLFVFPPLLSFLNLAIPRYAVSFGSSALNMALLGLLPLLLVSYAHKQLSLSVPLRAAPAAFFGLLAWMVVLALPLSAVTLGLAAAAAGGALLYIHSLPTGQMPGPRETLRQVIATGGFGDLFAVGVVLAVVYPVVGFPTDPATAGRVVNMYGHLLGFSLAFIGPYALLEAGIFDDE